MCWLRQDSEDQPICIEEVRSDKRAAIKTFISCDPCKMMESSCGFNVANSAFYNVHMIIVIAARLSTHLR